MTQATFHNPNTHRWRSNPRWWVRHDWVGMVFGAWLLFEVLVPWRAAGV